MPVFDGGIYRHYKGNVYRVICSAAHTETLEDMVVYEDVTDESKKWARPAAMWNEEVQVNGRSEPRFKYLAASLNDLDTKPLFKLIEAITAHMETVGPMGEDNEIAFYERSTGGVVAV